MELGLYSRLVEIVPNKRSASLLATPSKLESDGVGRISFQAT